MSHPRWPGYNTKTGDPTYDNESSKLNRLMYRDMKKNFRVYAKSRKRKKMLKRVEGGRYFMILDSIMKDIAKEKS